MPQILRGVSLMLCMVPINNLALGTLPPHQLKNASGLYNLTRNLGGAVGLALINTMLNTRTDLHITRLHEAVAAGRQVAEENIAAMTQRFADFGDAAESMALALLNQRAHKQALIMAFGDVFLGLTVDLRRPRPAGPVHAQAAGRPRRPGQGTEGRSRLRSRHCERSEAIQELAPRRLDCFVASLLAMTAGPGTTRCRTRRN